MDNTTVPKDFPPLPRGEKMGSATINGKYIELRRFTEEDMRAYVMADRQLRAPVETAHPLDLLLPEICQLIDTIKIEWEQQGCWSEWDQSVRERIAAYNIANMERLMLPVETAPALSEAQLSPEMQRVRFEDWYEDHTGNQMTRRKIAWLAYQFALSVTPDREQRPAASPDTHAFQNFHRSLCARFGYVHDPVDWRRDQVSLEEHIARQVTGEQRPAALSEAQCEHIVGKLCYRGGYCKPECIERADRERAITGEPVAREDFDKLSTDLTRARNLLVCLWDKHPDARAQIEGSTGNWFVCGVNLGAAPVTVEVAEPHVTRTSSASPELSEEQIIAAQLTVPAKNPDGEEWGPDEYDIAMAHAVLKASGEQRTSEAAGSIPSEAQIDKALEAANFFSTPESRKDMRNALRAALAVPSEGTKP